MPQSILVTGGAGYIGSHVVRQLAEAGHRVTVLDDLSTGFASAVLGGELITGSAGDRDLVTQLLRRRGVEAVMHFAAKTIVPESVADPLKYYECNTSQTRTLLQCCQDVGIRRFVFSSTAAVYGEPVSGLASEETATDPLNPYGRSKLMSEWMLRDLALASGLRYVILRYFNVAGCDPAGRIGQSTVDATLLVKVVCEAALGGRDSVEIFGTDYPTEDGTGVRDYIHVEDLADAHLRALDYLTADGESQILNCGYGHGFSVREIIGTAERLAGRRIRISERPRRAGDPARLIAVAERIRTSLGWSPKHADIEEIVGTSLAWERKLLGARETA